MDASAVDDLLDFSDPHHCINSYDDFSISAPIDTPHLSSYNHQFPPPPSSSIDDTHPHFLSSPPAPPPDFTDCLCSIPSADVEELEWLSKFVDDSFTDYHDEDGASLILASTTTTTRAAAYSTHNQNASWFFKSGFNNNSKPILMQPQQHHRFTPTTSTTVTSTMTTSSNETDKSSSSSKSISRRHYSYSASPMSARSSGGGGGGEISSSPSSSTRRCTHCGSEKTPQWRSGPLGPKTLCNACGVRYKSGRLVPEYRPAGSPTFVLTQHSNSHRKVLELRRQKQVSQGQPYRQQDFEVC